MGLREGPEVYFVHCLCMKLPLSTTSIKDCSILPVRERLEVKQRHGFMTRLGDRISVTGVQGTVTKALKCNWGYGSATNGRKSVTGQVHGGMHHS